MARRAVCLSLLSLDSSTTALRQPPSRAPTTATSAERRGSVNQRVVISIPGRGGAISTPYPRITSPRAIRSAASLQARRPTRYPRCICVQAASCTYIYYKQVDLREGTQHGTCILVPDKADTCMQPDQHLPLARGNAVGVGVSRRARGVCAARHCETQLALLLGY
ncbi:hypothetical protein EDB80DRAFT_297336 [Ilyonectria destructans]|nr:hypothetical protein EDB80DRAFT_297336 [Ilyonectria destructans]